MKYDRKFLYWLVKGRKMHLPESDMILTWSEFIPKGFDYTGEYICKKKKDFFQIYCFRGNTNTPLCNWISSEHSDKRHRRSVARYE